MKIKNQKGVVYIIGAGPGDPELFTFKGAKCLSECDVIFYDTTIHPMLLEKCNSETIKICVSETITDNPELLNDLNSQIVKNAASGKNVGVLQEGDPFIFGLGAEIARAAAKAEVKFKIIPGITSAIAAAAYAGIPLTYRGYSSTLAFATGHTDLNKKYTDVDWSRVATGVSTMVFFMGLTNLEMIVKKMIEHGRNPRTPIGIVSCGTTTQQETITSTLEEISAQIEDDNIKIKVPAIIIVGDVVGLRDELNWFESNLNP